MPKSLPKVLVLASQKGGAGKTTIAAHLGVAAAADGVSAVLYDTDPQESLAAWWNDREAKDVRFIKPPLAEFPAALDSLGRAGVQLVIIDTPPSMPGLKAVLPFADYVLVPAKASIHDLRAASLTVAVLNETEKPFAFVMTQVKPASSIATQATRRLSQHGPVAGLLADRVLYSAAMTGGLTAPEVEPKGRTADEVAEVWRFVGDRLSLARAPVDA